MNMEQDMIIMQDIFRYKQLGIDQNGRAYGQFEATGVRPSFVNRLEAAGHQAAVEPVPGTRAVARLRSAAAELRYVSGRQIEPRPVKRASAARLRAELLTQ